MVVGIKRRIQRNKVIGHDASSSINSTLKFQRAEFQRIWQMNAVGMHQFAMSIALIQFFVVIRQIAIVALGTIRIGLVRFLDTTASRRIITRGSQSYHRTVVQIDGTLHQSFAECTSSHNGTSIPILNGSCYNFTCRSGVFIHQNNEFPITQTAVSFGIVVLAARCPSFCINDQILLFEELISHIYGGIKVTTTVVLKVEDQINHSHALEFCQCL